MKSLLAAPMFLGLALAIVLSGCSPSADDHTAKPASAVPPAVATQPISSDWQTDVSQEQISAAVDAIQQDSPIAAEIDPNLRLPDHGIWADMSQQQARALYKSIPLDLGLRYVYGNGKNELVVFTDPHNQNDRRLMGLLLANASRLDATVYVFPLPSAPPVSNVARILCAASPEKAWQAWMKEVIPAPQDLDSLYTPRLPEDKEVARWKAWEGQFPAQPGCDGAVRADKIDVLAADLGVVFTPTVIFAHGRAWPGQFPEMADIRATWKYVHGRLKIGKSGDR